jgi:hypothetical protein
MHLKFYNFYRSKVLLSVISGPSEIDQLYWWIMLWCYVKLLLKTLTLTYIYIYIISHSPSSEEKTALVLVRIESSWSDDGTNLRIRSAEATHSRSYWNGTLLHKIIHFGWACELFKSTNLCTWEKWDSSPFNYQ